MSMKTEIEAMMPRSVFAVGVSRNNVRGSDTINVIVHYSVGPRTCYLDMNFDEKNKMNAEHIAAVINSYLKGHNVTEDNKLEIKTPLNDLADWENEGGNGNHRA